MPEKIVNILENIAAVKGQEYVEGLVDMANILAPRKKPSAANDGGCTWAPLPEGGKR